MKILITEGYKTIAMELPTEIDLSGSELLFYIFHLTKAFGLNGDEFNKYLDYIPKRNIKSIDEIYDRFLKGMSKLELRMKRIELKELSKHADST